MEQKSSVEANPLFFDSLFPSFQSTTPESVISDYRQRKRADSRAEHDSIDDANANLNVTKFGDSNVEFYAEVIGKLIGTIRDGVTTLIDDVKQRKMPKQQKSFTDVASEKLESRQLMDVMKLNSNATATNKMTNDLKSAAPTQKNSINGTDMSLGHQEIKLTTPSLHLVDESESDKRSQENGKIQLANESQSSIARNEVIQVIAKRTKTKQKRSDDTSREQLQRLDDDIQMDSNQSNADSPGDNDAKWFARHRNLIAQLIENHRMRKQKLVEKLNWLLSNDSIIENLRSTLRNSGNSSHFDENSQVAQLTPKQFLRMFHRGSDEHAELQNLAKSTLQRAFYKYARLYLIARKGYKDVRNFNRIAKEQIKDEVEEGDEEEEMISENFLPEAFESFQELNDDDFDEVLNFMTNNSRRNVQTIEAFAILILEIVGALYALSLGAIGQFQAAYFPEN